MSVNKANETVICECVLLLGIGEELYVLLTAVVAHHGKAGGIVFTAVVVYHFGKPPVHLVTGEGICVIDLDTTMPGLSINDFGESIRFGANHSAEDEKDLSKVNFDIELYEVYTRGFLEGAQGSLTRAELEYLPWGARLMTLECGIRFLTDYLEEDHYFRIHYPDQNLDRCRTQFKLVRDMEEQFDQMAAIVRKYAG